MRLKSMFGFDQKLRLDVIYLNIRECSDELLLLTLIVNNVTLKTSVANRATLHQRISKLVKEASNNEPTQMVVPYAIFQVNEENKIFPLPFKFTKDFNLENSEENPKIYNYEEIIPHLSKEISYANLDKYLKKLDKIKYAPIYDFLTDVGSTKFRDNLQETVQKFTESNTPKLKRSENDAIHFIYNYDPTFFNRVATIFRTEKGENDNIVQEAGEGAADTFFIGQQPGATPNNQNTEIEDTRLHQHSILSSESDIIIATQSDGDRDNKVTPGPVETVEIKKSQKIIEENDRKMSNQNNDKIDETRRSPTSLTDFFDTLQEPIAPPSDGNVKTKRNLQLSETERILANKNLSDESISRLNRLAQSQLEHDTKQFLAVTRDQDDTKILRFNDREDHRYISTEQEHSNSEVVTKNFIVPVQEQKTIKPCIKPNPTISAPKPPVFNPTIVSTPFKTTKAENISNFGNTLQNKKEIKCSECLTSGTTDPCQNCVKKCMDFTQNHLDGYVSNSQNSSYKEIVPNSLNTKNTNLEKVTKTIILI